MAQKSVLFNIFNDLTNAVKTIVDAKYIFLKDRPNTEGEDKPMSKFVVIDLPVSMEDYVIGTKKTLLNTYGVLYLFVQARKNTTLDVNAMGDFVEKAIALFPFVGDYCTAANPVVRLSGSDGHGFQVATITFDLQTKWKAFENNN